MFLGSAPSMQSCNGLVALLFLVCPLMSTSQPENPCKWGECQPGKYASRIVESSMCEGDWVLKCCDTCEEVEDCAAISFIWDHKYNSYNHFLGSGNFCLDDNTKLCEQSGKDVSMVKNASSYDRHPPYSIAAKRTMPRILADGRLEGLHRYLDFGRPGVCRGTVFVQAVGEVMPSSDGEMVTDIKCVDECCTKCDGLPGCVGWNVNGRECTFLRSVTGYHSCTGACWAGEKVQSLVV